ncbi:integrase arm-type DNA-binding domain-containing protein [Parasphingorhabdus sp. JC815]|uniref:tyrosine-type recombinase/integrase n=1 Tax=Parasphingorhabdus sp. JC815 TaxID=3232140 RepID=UPI00345A55D5
MGNLTFQKIRSLKEPGRYSDGNGLLLEIGKSGRGSWTVRVQSQGKRRDIGLGSIADVSLAEAREKAAEIRRLVKAGIDPVAKRKRKADVLPSFREAAYLVHAEHKKSWKNGKHQAQWISTLETYAFPIIGDRFVNEIEGPAIRDVLIQIWLEKPETARRVRQRIATVLDWSYAKGFRSSEAPLRSVSKGLPRQPSKNGHFAALPYEEIPDFIAALRKRVSIGRVALELLILTAARSGEIRGARHAEVDTARALWTIPAERMKMGRAHVVPLSLAAFDTLDHARMFYSPVSDLIFPGQKPTKPLSDMTLLKVIRDMEINSTVHGLRSSFRDWVADQTDYPREVAEAALAHAVPNKVEAAYRRTDFLEKRRALMDDWADYCMSKI